MTEYQAKNTHDQTSEYANTRFAPGFAIREAQTTKGTGNLENTGLRRIRGRGYIHFSLFLKKEVNVHISDDELKPVLEDTYDKQ